MREQIDQKILFEIISQLNMFSGEPLTEGDRLLNILEQFLRNNPTRHFLCLLNDRVFQALLQSDSRRLYNLLKNIPEQRYLVYTDEYDLNTWKDQLLRSCLMMIEGMARVEVFQTQHLRCGLLSDDANLMILHQKNGKQTGIQFPGTWPFIRQYMQFVDQWSHWTPRCLFWVNRRVVNIYEKNVLN